jgi:hypothetical protein
MKRVLLLGLLLGAVSIARADDAASIVDVRKIWDAAPHNAFTDLVRFGNEWFCVFREGKGHVSPDGALRVLVSRDGTHWESAALITSPDSDLRDAKITVTPQGELMLCGAGALHDKSQHTHQSLAWFSQDGRTWSKPYAIGDPDFWLWRVTWHRGNAYGIGYGCGPQDRSIRLYESSDGKKFNTLVERLYDQGYPNETSLVFDGDTCYCLLRRDDKPNSGLLGVARPPYTDWQWKDLGVRIGGPHMLRLDDGRFVAAVRLYDGGTRTSLVWIDPQSGTLKEFLKLPSGGDTSYARLAQRDGLLWVSYYSSHEKKTSIYLAKVKLPESVLDIGSRRELFVDDYLIDSLEGVELRMHTPEPREVVLVCDQPWEGNISAYYSIFADGDKFRMYYRGAHFDEHAKKSTHREVTCYAESRDGIHWEKPKLGLIEFNGSKENNIVLDSGPDSHNFTAFKDSNPNCSDDARYKALAGAPPGLHAYKSPDGVHWSLLQAEPVITDGVFDSQNLAFWNPVQKQYTAFFRDFNNGVRDIKTSTSQDFIHWTKGIYLDYGDAPREHLYTNAIQAYHRAPHLLIGMPTRFQPKHEQVEPVLMTSRDGRNFRRWPEPLVPITAPADRDGNRSNYMTWGLLELPGQVGELSVYATEAYYKGPASRVRRFTFRTDGFVSLHADGQGTVVSRPLRFAGKQLSLNSAAAAGGQVRVEIQDEQGQPLPDYALSDCRPLTADKIDQVVEWKQGSDLSALAGRPVRLKLSIENADVYSLQFVP